MQYDPSKLEYASASLLPEVPDIELLSGASEGTLRMALLDLEGESELPTSAGIQLLLKFRGADASSIKLVSALSVSPDGAEAPAALHNTATETPTVKAAPLE